MSSKEFEDAIEFAAWELIGGGNVPAIAGSNLYSSPGVEVAAGYDLWFKVSFVTSTYVDIATYFAMTDSNDAADFRPLRPNERKLLEKLLEPSFPGRDELRAQLDFLSAKALDDEGCLVFQCAAGPPAPVSFPIPTEGEGRDEDGEPIFVMLQVSDGYIGSLILQKGTPGEAHGLPAAETVRVFASTGENPGGAPTPYVPPLGYRNPPRK